MTTLSEYFILVDDLDPTFVELRAAKSGSLAEDVMDQFNDASKEVVRPEIRCIGVINGGRAQVISRHPMDVSVRYRVPGIGMRADIDRASVDVSNGDYLIGFSVMDPGKTHYPQINTFRLRKDRTVKASALRTAFKGKHGGWNLPWLIHSIKEPSFDAGKNQWIAALDRRFAHVV